MKLRKMLESVWAAASTLTCSRPTRFCWSGKGKIYLKETRLLCLLCPLKVVFSQVMCSAGLLDGRVQSALSCECWAPPLRQTWPYFFTSTPSAGLHSSKPSLGSAEWRWDCGCHLGHTLCQLKLFFISWMIDSSLIVLLFFSSLWENIDLNVGMCGFCRCCVWIEECLTGCVIGFLMQKPAEQPWF